MILIHLVNYRQDNVLRNLPVDVRIDAGKKVASVSLISPDLEGSSELEYKIKGDRCRFVVPSLEVYDVLVVRLDGS